jgi:hypothetical protein
MIIPEGTELFNKRPLREFVREREQQLGDFISSMREAEILDSNINSLLDAVAGRFLFKVPDLNLDRTTQDTTDDAVLDRQFVGFPRQTLLTGLATGRKVKGSRIRLFIPFEGDQDLFLCMPSTYTTVFPLAELGENELVLSYFLTGTNEEEVKREFEKDVGQIRTWLGWVRTEVGQFNESLLGKVETLLSERRAKIEQLARVGAAMGFPLRRRENAPKTYSVPTIRRDPPRRRPEEAVRPEPLEPTLEIGEYEFILTVVMNMVTVMELSPRAFKGMREEDLRHHFLVQLNGQYKGSATGETFNFEGRTDILIRVDGRNVFIAECKFWDGPASLTKAVDQLLSYTSWRDTKTAILVFNRERSFSEVVSAIPGTVRGHQHFIRELTCPYPTGFRCILSHRDDPRRELLLTVLAFDVPSR